VDFLKELLDLVFRLIWALIDGLAALLQRAAGTVSQLSQVQAQMCAGLILFGIVGAWFIRKVNWFNAKMFSPQTVTLRTDKAPFEVMMADLKGCLASLLILGILALIAYALYALSKGK